jgi:group I intron endonuclease
MIIYQITNKITNEFYIGKTKNPKDRFYKHKYNAIKNKSQAHIHRAMRKYGVDNFTFTLLDEASSGEELNKKEIEWILKLSPKYNMTKGGDGGDTSSSVNYKLAIKKYHNNQPPERYATYGMLGKKHPMKGKSLTKNCCPVICEDVEYASVGDAQKAYPGISIRKRIDNPNYPTFYRLKPKTKRK